MKAKNKNKNKEIIQEAEFTETKFKQNNELDENLTVIFEGLVSKDEDGNYTNIHFKFGETHNFDPIFVSTVLRVVLHSYLDKVPKESVEDFAKVILSDFLVKPPISEITPVSVSLDETPQTETASSSEQSDVINIS